LSGPQISQSDDRIGFVWMSATGDRMTLVEVVTAPDSEADRLLPTHLEALDDVLIDGTGRFGDMLGGGRFPIRQDERTGLREFQKAVDRSCAEYATAREFTGLAIDFRAGQIMGTAALLSMRARTSLGLCAPEPFAGQLDDPSIGVVSGFADLLEVEPTQPWRGARWVVRTQTGPRFPATLSMLMFDSSGVNKDAALDEHRAALKSVVAAAKSSVDLDHWICSGAIDWLLYDWLMAHRDGPDSAAVEIKSGRLDDAEMIVAAVVAAIRLRACVNPCPVTGAP
jgi:hypothetical protein